MAVRKSKNTEERIIELNEKISNCGAVLDELSTSNAWKIVMQDLEKSRAKIDENWQNVTDETKLKELRITKLAISYLVNLLRSYENDRIQARQELFKIMNPNSVINKDYDTEGITEEGDGYGE